MASDSVYYRHSGHVGVLGVLLMAVAGLVSSAVLGAVYGYLIWYNPFIYVNFFATLICAGLCGASVSLAAKASKVRNDGFVLWSGLAVGVFCLYSGWVFWLYAATEQTYFSPTDPEWIFTFIGDVAEVGAWTIFDWTPKGGALYAIWAIEAVMIVGSAVAGSHFLVGESENTFCDRCNAWAEDVYTSPLLAPIGNPEELKSRLERGEYTPLTDLELAQDVQVPGVYARLVIQAFKTCWDFFCLDVKHMALSQDGGKVQESETLLVDNLLIGSDLHDTIRERFGGASGAAG